MIAENTTHSRARLIVRIMTATIVSISLLVFVGWHLDIAALKSIFPGLTAMNPGGTALAFLLASLSALMMSEPKMFSYQDRASYILAGATILIALSYFIFKWIDLDIGIDQIIYRTKLDYDEIILGHPNRMAPNTAIAFLLSGLALIFVDVRIQRIWPTQLLALLGMTIALMTIMGYAYSALSLTAVEQYIPMALNTAVDFALLNIAILCVRPNRGLTAVFCSAGFGGILIRRLLPVVVLMPAIAGGLYRYGEDSGIISELMAITLFSLTTICMLATLIWWTAVSLEKLDRRRYRAEEDLREAKRNAEAASDAKSDFLANMSHELRTPLNSILGLTKILLQENDITQEHKVLLRIVDKSSMSLLTTVNDILDLSKIESGAVHFEYKPFNIVKLLNALTDQIKPLADQKQLVLDDNIGDLPFLNVVGDEFRLSRILTNLAGNAIKYTYAGKVEIKTTIKYLDSDKIEFICSVKDTGIGIAPDKIDYIFEKFTQAEESIERRFGGTGLGLNITKQLVEKMGGYITVESEIGKGSCFTVAINFNLADNEKEIFGEPEKLSVPMQTRPKIAINNARILIAEDHEFNQVLIIELIKKLGCKYFKVVPNGKEALREYHANNYDIILMDCHMPLANGYEVSKTIRENENGLAPESKTIIIAVTADAMLETREKCFKAGMDYYMTKPIDENEFTNLMQGWFVLDDITAKSSQSSQTRAPADIEILRDYANHDAKVIKELIDLFISKSTQDVVLLKSHIKDENNIGWIEAAHGLKGGAGYVGANELCQLSNMAQNMSQTTEIEKKELFKKIVREHRLVCNFLNSLNQ